MKILAAKNVFKKIFKATFGALPKICDWIQKYDYKFTNIVL